VLTIDYMDGRYVSVLRGGEQSYRLLTEDNQWVIQYLSKIEGIFINLCLQDLIAEYMGKYIQGLLDEGCIDADDAERLSYLSEKVEKIVRNILIIAVPTGNAVSPAVFTCGLIL